MKTVKIIITTLLVLILSATISQAQEAKTNENSTEMKTYLIERELPGAGAFESEALQGISKKSCEVIKEMGPQIEWLHSYVTTDKVYCVYRATSEAELKVHAEKGGFPINSIAVISTKIGPSTALAKKE